MKSYWGWKFLQRGRARARQGALGRSIAHLGVSSKKKVFDSPYKAIFGGDRLVRNTRQRYRLCLHACKSDALCRNHAGGQTERSFIIFVFFSLVCIYYYRVLPAILRVIHRRNVTISFLYLHLYNRYFYTFITITMYKYIYHTARVKQLGFPESYYLSFFIPQYECTFGWLFSLHSVFVFVL